jgi:hypothetical protein
VCVCVCVCVCVSMLFVCGTVQSLQTASLRSALEFKFAPPAPPFLTTIAGYFPVPGLAQTGLHILQASLLPPVHMQALVLFLFKCSLRFSNASSLRPKQWNSWTPLDLSRNYSSADRAQVGGMGLHINAYSSNVTASLELAKFLISRRIQKLFSSCALCAPCTCMHHDVLVLRQL